MKGLASGDWHYREKAPRNRTDSYLTTFFDKIDFIFDTAEMHGCEFIIQPGDLFDSFRASDALKKWMIDKLLSKI